MTGVPLGIQHMKHNRLHGAHGIPPGWLIVLVFFMGKAAWAQVPQPDTATVAEEGPAPSIWVEPRLSAEVSFTNNGNLAAVGPQSEQIYDLRAGLLAVVNRPRIRGSLDYSLSALHFAQGTSRDELRHNLDADATLNAWDRRAFIDLSASIEDQTVSAFRSQQGELLRDINRARVGSLRISPYLVGVLGGVADYEVRYSLRRNVNDAPDRSNLTLQELGFNLGRQPQGSKLGWGFDGYAQQVDYSLRQNVRLSRLSASLIYAITPELIATVLAGQESNDVLSPTRRSFDNIGMSLDWRPSQRTRLFAQVEDRYFGDGHSVALDYRTPRTVWRAFSTRRVGAENPLDAAVASVGLLSDLINSHYLQTEPDPVLRARLVAAELRRLGLAGDVEVFQNFLTSRVTLENRRELSFVLLGVRSVLNLTLGRVSTSRLGQAIVIGDDFDDNTRIDQRGWSLNYAYRFTPLTSGTLSWSQQRTSGTALSASSRMKSWVLGATTRLAERTSASVQLRHTRYEASVNPYRETAISGVINRRF